MKLILALILTAIFSASAQMNEVASDYNAFGFKLLAQTRRSMPGKNIFVSPAGLAFALSMVANGAKGETLRQILSTLQVNGVPDLNADNEGLLNYKPGPKIALEVANSLWTDTTLESLFLSSSKQYFNAEAATVNFQNPKTVKRINDWVSDQTHGKIDEIVKAPLEGDLRLIVLNAIYFKGDWAVPFDAKLTHDQPFTLGNGQTISHPRMSRSGEFEYYENEAFQEVRLPYAGNEASLYVILPRQTMDDFLPTLTPENWPRWSNQLLSRKGTLEMPRFKLNNSYNLNEVLKALGMPLAFSRQADLSGISAESLHIGWVKQKTYVDVNEQGTEAAAVTGIGVHAMLVRREPPPFHMVADRPFLVALRENQSGLILFLGTIADPRSHE
jgi:serine protease inhibitor